MSKTFRVWKIDEPLLLPPTVGDFVAEDHLARFALNLVRDDIDLAEITGSYGSERGQPPFDPTMMTALLLYSYCCGRVGHRLHRPQPPQAGPEEESVRSFVDSRLSRLMGVGPVGEIIKRPRSRKYRIQCWSLAQQKNRRVTFTRFPLPLLYRPG
jgi:hypothetical protein